jgi:hypothetical protein
MENLSILKRISPIASMYHRFHMDCPGLNLCLHVEPLANYCLSHVMARELNKSIMWGTKMSKAKRQEASRPVGGGLKMNGKY